MEITEDVRESQSILHQLAPSQACLSRSLSLSSLVEHRLGSLGEREEKEDGESSWRGDRSLGSLRAKWEKEEVKEERRRKSGFEREPRAQDVLVRASKKSSLFFLSLSLLFLSLSFSLAGYKVKNGMKKEIQQAAIHLRRRRRRRHRFVQKVVFIWWWW